MISCCTQGSQGDDTDELLVFSSSVTLELTSSLLISVHKVIMFLQVVPTAGQGQESSCTAGDADEVSPPWERSTSAF